MPPRTNNINRKLSIQREKRLVRVDEYRCQGITDCRQIGVMEGVSHVTISKDQRELDRRYREATTRGSVKRRRLAVRRIEYVAQKAMVSYERSKQNEEQITTQYVNEECKVCKGTGMREGTDEWCDECKGKGIVEKEIVTKKVRGQAGDAAHLRITLDCFREVAKLQGLYLEDKESKGGTFYGGNHVHKGSGEGLDEVGVERIAQAMKALDMARKGEDVIEVEVDG